MDDIQVMIERQSLNDVADDLATFFDAGWYAFRYPDAVNTGSSPLTHFVSSGLAEGRSPSLLFDSDWYAAAYPEVSASGMPPFLHYLRVGERQGYQPCDAAAVDSYFIWQFIRQYRCDIHGRVLVIAESQYVDRLRSGIEALDDELSDEPTSIVSMTQLDTLAVDVDATFDCIVAIQIADTMPILAKEISYLRSLLKRNGVLLLTCRGSQATVSKESGPAAGVEPEALRGLLRQFFDPKTLVIETWKNVDPALPINVFVRECAKRPPIRHPNVRSTHVDPVHPFLATARACTPPGATTVAASVTTGPAPYGDRGIADLMTVIIPFLNAEPFLAEAIESVLRQTCHAWEIILIDDGSTDRSREVARRYETLFPGRIQSISHVNDEHRGLAQSRNLGISRAKGSHFLPLDADDVLLPNAIAQFRRVFRQNPDVGLAFGQAIQFHEDGSMDARIEDFPYEMGIVPDRETIFRDFIDFQWPAPCTCATVFRGDVLRTVGSFIDGLWGYEDVAMWSQIVAQFPTYYLRGLVALYRRHGGSMTAEGGFDVGEFRYQAFVEWREGYKRTRTELGRT